MKCINNKREENYILINKSFMSSMLSIIRNLITIIGLLIYVFYKIMIK